MPNKNKLLSKKKALDEALFKESYSLSDKASEILTKSQSVLNEATVDFFTYFFGNEVKEANSRDLYDLSDYGAKIFSDCRKEVVQSQALLDRVLRLAALCFPYSPSTISKYIYFSLEENYRANEKNQTSYLVKYFFFLKWLISEESVPANFRLACLCGAMKFYESNNGYLTYSFIIQLLSLFDSSQAKEFLLTYKDKVIFESESVDSYKANYSILFTQNDEFWLDMGIKESDISHWKEISQNRLDEKVNIDKIFIREHKLSPISMFELALKKIIKQFPDFIKNCEREQQKSFIEKLSVFFDKQHPLAEFFSETNFRQEISQIIEENAGSRYAHEKFWPSCP